MVSEPSVLRPESMDEMEQQIMLEMSKKLEEQKQSTEDLKFQIEELLQSQAKLQKNLETMMPRFFSHTSIPPRPPSQPPDPPDFNKSNPKPDPHVFLPLLSELMSLKQHDDSVETYLEKFERALSRLSLSMPYAVNIFLSNMNPHLASRVKQFDVTTVAYAAWLAKLFESSPLHAPAIQPRAPFNPYQNQNNQSHDNSPNTTSLLAPLETTKTLPYKPNFPTETSMEKSCLKPSCEVIQESGMTKSQIFVMECEDATMSGGETNVETKSLLEKETIPSSVLCDQVPATQSQDNNMTQQEKLIQDIETIREIGLIQEHESHKLTDAIMEVDCVHSQEFSSQFQVPNPSLEPSRRCHKESLVVVNDLSYDHGCVTGKTIGSICDFELGQDNSLDEEEFKGFKLGKLSKNERRLSAVCLLEKKEVTKTISSWNNRVWEPGGVLIEHDKWKWSGKCHELSIVVRLMQGLSSTRWSYGKVAVLSQELQQPEEDVKTLVISENEQSLECVGDEPSDDEHKDIKTACVFLETSLNRERLIQLGAPPVFSDWLFAMNRIQVRLKMVLLQEFLWLILLSSKMFKSSYVPQNKNQTNQKLSSYRKLLLRLIYPLHNNEWRSFYRLMIKAALKGKEKTVSFNIAVTSCSRFGFFSYSSWMGSHNSYDLASCVLRQRKNYVMALFPIGEALILVNDQHTLVAQKKETETSTGCCIRGLNRQRGTVYDAEDMRLLDTKDGSSEIILKGLCASGVEMETWRVKKSLEWLNKLTTATNLAQMFMDHVCKLQGTPQNMLDRDPTFLIELFRVLRADLSSDTTYEFIFVQPRPAHFPSRLEETSFAVDMDRNFQKEEVLITPSTQNKAVTKALTQWKEHPPDQFYMVLNGRNSLFHS